MKNTVKVLFLSEQSSTILPMLEQQLSIHTEIKIKFISPLQVYQADFDESNFIMLDYDFYLKNTEMLKPVFSYPQKLSVFATIKDPLQFNEILKSTKASHLFGMSGTHTISDMTKYLLAMIQNKFWSTDTFVNLPASYQSRTKFISSDHLDQQIENVLNKIDFSESFDGFKSIIMQILNEAITNALYNAPVDANGNHIYNKKNRRDIVTSELENAPELLIIEDDEKTVLSIKDCFGSLKKETVDHFITHGLVAEKEGGAGVGLFLILKHAHKVIINIDSGKSTEFLIVLHKFKRFFHYQNLEKSFHIYQRNKV